MIVRYFGFKLPTTKRLFSIMSEPWILSAKLLFGIILMHTCLKGVESRPTADEVVELPGQPPVTFKQFAGYISLDDAKPRSLFYYFVEAESDSSSKPLVLWLNGGSSRYISSLQTYWNSCITTEAFGFDFLQDLVVRLWEKGLLLSMVLLNQVAMFWLKMSVAGIKVYTETALEILP